LRVRQASNSEVLRGMDSERRLVRVWPFHRNDGRDARSSRIAIVRRRTHRGCPFTLRMPQPPHADRERGQAQLPTLSSSRMITGKGWPSALILNNQYTKRKEVPIGFRTILIRCIRRQCSSKGHTHPASSRPDRVFPGIATSLPPPSWGGGGARSAGGVGGRRVSPFGGRGQTP